MNHNRHKGHVHFYDPLTSLGLLSDKAGHLVSFRYRGEAPLIKGESIAYKSTWDVDFAEWVEPMRENRTKTSGL